MVERIWVCWNLVCSATANFSGCPSRMCWWSLTLVSIDQPVTLVNTWPHLHGMPLPYTPGVFNPSWSVTWLRKLEIFLGGRPTLLMVCLAVLLRRPCVVWTNGRRATEVGICLGLEVFTFGLRAYQICFKLYLFFLKVVWSNSNSSRRLSLSHRALALALRLQEGLVCWKDGDVIKGSDRGLCG
jgi:hypothetical protein